MSDLAKEVEPMTSEHITDVLVSSPLLPGLCEEHIEAAVKSLGMDVLWTPKLVRQPCTVTTAYAGCGLCLCRNFTSPSLCKEQEKDLPVHRILVVTYNRDALLVH